MTLRFVFIGLSVTSSWGNGHATTYRALLSALAAEGHEVTFLERDVPWYGAHRDLPDPPFCQTSLYGSVRELRERHAETVRDADVVVIGSFVPEGNDIAEWVFRTTGGVTLFYDIDTPVTLAALERGECGYLRPSLIPRYDAYLSFTGGPVLQRLEKSYGARRAVALYCSVDPEAYPPAQEREEAYALGYLGTYSEDRQPGLERLLIDVAERRPQDRFVVGGSSYPAHTPWPANVTRLDHVPPKDHPGFYHGQSFTLNLTRSDMTRTGYAPSVRLFEAAATATPVISDTWPGIETFFRPGREILLVDGTQDVVRILEETDARERQEVGRRARQRILDEHTPADRAGTLVGVAESLLEEGVVHV